jgi:hypothetical protein
MPAEASDYRAIKAKFARGRHEATVILAFDSVAGPELAEAQAELAELEVRLQVKPSDPALKRERTRAQSRVKRARAEAIDHSEPFRLGSISPAAVRALRRQFPPTDDQKADWEEGGNKGVLEVDMEQYSPALVAACSIEPKLEDADTKDMWFSEDSPFTRAQLEALFWTAYRLCEAAGVVDIDLGKGSGSTRS